MTIQRRTIVQGIVWGTPAIVALSAAPAFAVSQLRTLVTHGSVANSSNTSGQLTWVKIDMSAYGGSGGGSAGFTISNTAAGAPITDTKIILWYPMAGLNFTPDANSVGWTFAGTTTSGYPASMPVADRSSYTGYIFTYAPTVTATAGSTTYGATPGVDNLAVTANVAPGTPFAVGITFYQQSFATYDGTDLTYESSGSVKLVV